MGGDCSGQAAYMYKLLNIARYMRDYLHERHLSVSTHNNLKSLRIPLHFHLFESFCYYPLRT